MYYYQGAYNCINSLGYKGTAAEYEVLKLQCKKDIEFIHKLYSSSDMNVTPYVYQELAFGLEKTLKQYHKLTDGTAYADLDKLKK